MIPREASLRDTFEVGLLDAFDPLFVAEVLWQCSCGTVTAKAGRNARFAFCRTCQQSALVMP